MRVSQVDPRSFGGADEKPSYRVYFWHQPEVPGVAAQVAFESDEWQLTDVDNVFEAINWASDHADGREFELFCDGTGGSVRLAGRDPSAQPEV